MDHDPEIWLEVFFAAVAAAAAATIPVSVPGGCGRTTVNADPACAREASAISYENKQKQIPRFAPSKVTTTCDPLSFRGAQRRGICF
jgi:hypothetical protein